jgi:two-component system, LytTR family, sensor kinase
MKSKFPIKNLSWLTYWMSFTSGFFVFAFLFLFAKPGDFPRAIIYSITAFILMASTGFANIGVLLLLERKLARHSFAFVLLRFIFSYLFNFCIFIIGLVFFTYYDNWLMSLVHLDSPYILIIVVILYSTLCLTQQNSVILQDQKAHSDLENSILKTANMEAANQLLRQQIHPHFLFNALNTLKSLYRRNPKTAEEYLIRLSDFLRASISDNNARLTRLKDEIKLCLDYLEMQKIRFGQALVFSVTISDDKLENGYVPSFSLQPLLENAIKHNEITEESPLYISISQEGEWVRVKNNLQLKVTSEASTGSGLSNLAERYRILSNDELIIIDDGKYFSVSIKILGNENNNN